MDEKGDGPEGEGDGGEGDGWMDKLMDVRNEKGVDNGVETRVDVKEW